MPLSDTTPYAVYRHLVQDALWNSEVKYSNSNSLKCFYEHSELVTSLTTIQNHFYEH